MTQEAGEQKSWDFSEHVSAAGWVDHDTLLIASETGLWRFSLTTGRKDLVVALEADNPITRSNDGRADPWGGFWIGTMGKRAEPGAGAIYRFWQGALRRLGARRHHLERDLFRAGPILRLLRGHQDAAGHALAFERRNRLARRRGVGVSGPPRPTG